MRNRNSERVERLERIAKPEGVHVLAVQDINNSDVWHVSGATVPTETMSTAEFQARYSEGDYTVFRVVWVDTPRRDNEKGLWWMDV